VTFTEKIIIIGYLQTSLYTVIHKSSYYMGVWSCRHFSRSWRRWTY